MLEFILTLLAFLAGTLFGSGIDELSKGSKDPKFLWMIISAYCVMACVVVLVNKHVNGLL